MKKSISVILVLTILLSCFSVVGFAVPKINGTTEVLFTENFDAASESVTINNSTFSYVARPADGEKVSTDTAYGALMSSTTAAAKVRINFDTLYTGEFTYEMDFRLEDVISEGSNEIKLLRLNKNNTTIGLITLWDSDANGYKIRVATRDEEGTAKYKISSYVQYKKWHTLRVIINTFENNYDIYVNDVLVCENCLPYQNSFEGGVNSVDIYTDKAKNTSLLVDNISLYRKLGVYSNTYIISDDVILGSFENVTVEEFASNIETLMLSTVTLYSDYETKIQNTGIVADGDILEVKSVKDTSNIKLYTINNIVYANTYYVAPNGNNLNDGTTPQTAFASLDYAKYIVRLAKKNNPNQAYTVKILAGDYQIDSSIEFTAADSGSAEYPILYEAYGNGPVNFKGSKTLSADKAVKVTDPEILNTLISSEAQKNLYKIDLKAEGIEIPEMPAIYGFGKEGYQPLRVYINGQALTEAQFPNVGDVFIPLKSVNNEETSTADGFYDINYYDNDAPLSRTSKWNTKDRDIYIAGTLLQQWEYNHIRVKTFDPANGRIVFDKNRSGEMPIGRSYFYFTNVFEEIDVPGESYIDEKNGILYFMPNGDLTNARIEIGTFKDTMISMTDCDYITFKNLNFGYTGNKIIDAKNTDYFTLDGCELAHTGATAIKLSGHHTLIQNNHIYDLAGYTGIGGIHLTDSGDRATLTSGESKILNNKIHDTDVVYKVSQSPAIYILDSVGTEISNNEIYNGTAYVIRVTDANDILIKRNEIYNAVTMSSDAGAVTWGRDITLLGFQVIENYFHDIGNDIGIREQESTGLVCKRTGQQALFHDDGSSGPYAYGNIFYQSKPNETINTYSSIKANGGQYGIWENNIFIGGHTAAYFGSWRTGYNGKTVQDIWWLRQYNVYELGAEHNADGKGGSAIYWDRISNPDINFFENEVWKEKYAGQFGAYWTLFTSEQKEYLAGVYDSSVSNIKYNTNLLNAAAGHADLLTNTNVMKNNVLINTLTPIEYKDTANYHEAEGSVTGIYTTQEAQGFFKNYGMDFTMTEEGIASIRETVPVFQAIDFDKIGLQSDIGKEPSGFTIQNSVQESDKLTVNVVNEGSTAKTGIMVVISYNEGKVAETKLVALSLSGKTAEEKIITLTKAYDSTKIFILKDIFTMRIFSNMIE